MNKVHVTDAEITYAVIKLQDTFDAVIESGEWGLEQHQKDKEIVLKTYQALFSPDHLHLLSKVEFESFLLIRNNRHWDSLHRVGKYMTEDMEGLRSALALLLDETRPIQERLNQLRPERYWGANSMISYLGMPVLTAILQVMFPDCYGVWNNTSDAGMKKVRLWDKRWESMAGGDSYVEINNIYLRLSKELNLDLWTLDWLWWLIKK